MSNLEISNMALSLIGEAAISDLDAPNSVSRTVKTHFHAARDWVTVQRSWKSATTRASLDTPDIDPPAFGYSNSYTLPADCLRVLEVLEGDRPTGWTLEAGRLLVNSDGGLQIRYLRRFADDEEIPAVLVDVIALELARRICIPITSSNTLSASLTATMFGAGGKDQGVLGAAAMTDGMQGRTEAIRASRLTAARFGIHGYGAI